MTSAFFVNTYIRAAALTVCAMFIFLLAVPSVNAQLGARDEDVIAALNPRVPQAGEQFTITLNSFVTDINRARVTFRVGGIVTAQGIGLKTQEFTTPQVGSTERIEITIETIDRGVLTKEIVLRPAQVDLVYEATNSYVPDGYKGKKLPAHFGGVRLIALPYFIDAAGNKIDSKSLVYTWHVGDQAQQQASGFGRDTFEYRGSAFYRTKDVHVEVSSVDRSLTASRNISIPAFDPVIRFYPVHPIWGLDLRQAINANEAYSLQQERLVEAAPFYFSDIEDERQTTFRWEMNGRPMQAFGDRKQVNLRAPDGLSGQARITLSINHESRILQIADAFFSVLFGQQNEAGVVSRDGDVSSNAFFGN